VRMHWSNMGHMGVDAEDGVGDDDDIKGGDIREPILDF